MTAEHESNSVEGVTSEIWQRITGEVPDPEELAVVSGAVSAAIERGREDREDIQRSTDDIVALRAEAGTEPVEGEVVDEDKDKK